MSDLLVKEYPTHRYYIEGLVAAEAITFLHGDTGIGKSPLTWEMSRAISANDPVCFGLGCNPGRVLYIEVDTPEWLVAERIRRLAGLPLRGDQWMWYFSPGLNVLDPKAAAVKELRAIQASFTPDVVFWNTLRKIYSLSDIASETASAIYAAIIHLFPGAAHVVNGHDKKEVRDPSVQQREDEQFAGTKAWMNDCQVGLHLVRGKDDCIVLKNTKNQIHRKIAPLVLQLTHDNARVSLFKEAQKDRILHLFSEAPGETKTDRVLWVAKQMGVTERTIWDYLSK